MISTFLIKLEIVFGLNEFVCVFGLVMCIRLKVPIYTQFHDCMGPKLNKKYFETSQLLFM